MHHLHSRQGDRGGRGAALSCLVDISCYAQLPGTIYTAAKEIEAAGGAALPCLVDISCYAQLPSTIYTAAKEIEAAGGAALPCLVDVRDEEQVQASIEQVLYLIYLPFFLSN